MCYLRQTYPVSVHDSQAARVGTKPLPFDLIEHVHEQRAVHLVSQVDGCVTLKKNIKNPMKKMNH